ncbi:Sec-independent protein translocase protein TatB [Kaistia terrae]|uniref:Sec-independent protein translocase protein TatB n=1 Tax=Kaistia terrae TaxID=537017 RepID=A0ABW0PV60_9HYPH|nr:Sec-independent protein translocase protein TatB [Kaistia terrae]MCX5577375.1 Sec-independent protein translocase protein TatB [Kaistia terrae]
MLDIGWSELLLIAVVAIVVVGPKDLPPMLRALGRTVSKMRKMAGEFQGQFNEALKEAELDDVKKSFDELRGLNPLNDIKSSLSSLPEAIAKPSPSPVPPPADQPAQLMTDSDILPTPPPEVSKSPVEASKASASPVEASKTVEAVAPVVAPKPKRAAATKAVSAEGSVPKPRASRAKPKSIDGVAAVSAEAKAPARIRKPKPTVETAAPAASLSAANESVVASTTEESKT